MRQLNITWCCTPWGWIAIAFSDRGIVGLTLPRPTRDEAVAELAGKWPQAKLIEHRLEGLKAELDRYFRGYRVTFEEPLDFEAATPFRRAVWQEVRRIPWGETRTYREIAAAIGNPKATRAVGQALMANPIPIIIPCHRVIYSDGNLGGFSYGVEFKRKLLELEGRTF
ncbi:MAG TPA: methylated-DNA--[protein]-cysteine S-methyltransferase [Chloroflexi bacterium]|nr:methylated-DNA--[protein]-cysteine S-methyltransferase [Chloroflexota bacterium]